MRWLGNGEVRGHLGNPNIGRATVFVSWGLTSTVGSLITALEAHMTENDLDASTYFWVCTTSIRQLEGKDSDVKRLGEMVEMCESTVIYIDVWDRMVKR